MKRIVKITSFQEAQPKKGTWFDYYGDIFVSVVPIENRRHLRRKSGHQSGKKDSEMCTWHLKWQYEIIENRSGISSSGTRTYEVPIIVNGERHIVDRLINNIIAIEFQHTVSVSLDEMDSRSEAHRAAGFLPYLVLDLTDINYDDFVNGDVRVTKKLVKWSKSEYYIGNNLFIDFGEIIIRCSDNVSGGHTAYSQYEFIEHLLDLETHLSTAMTAHRIAKETEIENQRVRQLEFDRRRKEKNDYRMSIRKEENRAEKFDSTEYNYFRKCYRDSVILPFIIDYAKDLFEYSTGSAELNESTYEKCHHYRSQENDFVIFYVNVSYIEREYYQTKWGRRFKRKFTYLYSYVEVCAGTGRERTKHTFEFDGGKTTHKL